MLKIKKYLYEQFALKKNYDVSPVKCMCKHILYIEIRDILLCKLL